MHWGSSACRGSLLTATACRTSQASTRGTIWFLPVHRTLPQTIWVAPLQPAAFKAVSCAASVVVPPTRWMKHTQICLVHHAHQGLNTSLAQTLPTWWCGLLLSQSKPSSVPGDGHEQ